MNQIERNGWIDRDRTEKCGGGGSLRRALASFLGRYLGRDVLIVRKNGGKAGRSGKIRTCDPLVPNAVDCSSRIAFQRVR